MSDNFRKTERAFPIWQILVKKWFIIVIATILFFGGALTFSLVKIHPEYTAHMSVVLKMTVNDQGISTNTNNATLAKRNLPTVKACIESNSMGTVANDSYNQEKQLDGQNINFKRIAVVHGDKSMIFSISYTDKSADVAKAKLKSVIENAPLILRQNIQAETVDLVPVQNFFDITVSDSSASVVIIGTIVGLAVGVGLALLLYVLDNTMKDREELEEITGASVLAYISNE